jgi:hypothetical protein
VEKDIQNIIKESLQRRSLNGIKPDASALRHSIVPQFNNKINSITSLNKNLSDNKQQSIKTKNMFEKLKHFVGTTGNIYLTFGGVGDLVLLLGSCYDDPSAKVVFFSNGNAAGFGSEFLKYFNLKSFIHSNVMGTNIAIQSWQMILQTGRLAPSQHLAKNLDYGDWKTNKKYYENKIKASTDWIERIGKAPYLENEKVLILAPSGSVKADSKRRYLTTEEFKFLVDLYLSKGYTIYSVGSEQDFNYYPKINNDKHVWLTSNKTLLNNGKKIIHSFETFLSIINSAKEVISVDTWLKTYTLLAGIPTKVLENKFNGSYKEWGYDVSDYVFLNTNIYKNLEIKKIEDLLFKDN